jgi:hypothetical protein
MIELNKNQLRFFMKYHRPKLVRKGKVYYISQEESCSCCKAIRSPSNAWPNSHVNHAHTIKHLKTFIREKPEEQVEKEILIPFLRLRLYEEYGKQNTNGLTINTVMFDFTNDQFTEQAKEQILLAIAESKI